jgi:hypothetical protein
MSVHASANEGGGSGGHQVSADQGSTGPSPGQHCLSIGALQQRTRASAHGLITTRQYKWDAKNRELDNIFATEGVANLQTLPQWRRQPFHHHNLPYGSHPQLSIKEVIS